MSDKKREYELLEELRTIYNSKNDYKTMSQIINTVKELGGKYSCICITDENVLKELSELEKKIKLELSDLEKKSQSKGGKKTKNRRSKFKKTRRKLKGGEIHPDGYVVIYGALLLMIATLIIAWKEPTPIQRTRAEFEYRMAEYERYQNEANQRAERNREIESSSQTMRKPEPGEECPICLEPMVSKLYTMTPCNHMFHTNCIEGVRRRSENPRCPLCRAPI
jgi:hypothetical protein